MVSAGHDSGLIVFKLDRERPAFSLHGNMLFYIRDKHVRACDLNTGADSSVISVRKLGNQFTSPRTLSYNPAERAVVVTSVSLGYRGGEQVESVPKVSSFSPLITVSTSSSVFHAT